MLPFKDGLLTTTAAVLGATCHLINECKFAYVMTSRFNQDIVENFFSCVRAKGYNNDTRTAIEFERASRNITVNWLIKEPGRGSNCELDCDTFIGLLQQQLCQNPGSMVNIEPLPASADANNNDPSVPAAGNEATDVDAMFDDSVVVTDWHSAFSLSDVESNVVCYIAGYIITKLDKRSTCRECNQLFAVAREAMKSRLSSIDKSNVQLIELKAFSWAKWGLTVPPESIFQMCVAIEKIVQTNLESLSTGKHVMKYLWECVVQGIEVCNYDVTCACTDHVDVVRNKIIRLYLRIRIHHFVRIRNRELKEFAQPRSVKVKRNRKAKKIMHE